MTHFVMTTFIKLMTVFKLQNSTDFKIYSANYDDINYTDKQC